MDTSGMNGLGLTSHIGRITNFNRMEEWKGAVEEHMKAVSENPSITEISVATSSQSSSLVMVPDIQDNDEEVDDDYHIVTTTL